MKQSFIKTLCCITAVLLAIQVFTFSAFAEETRILTNDNYQSIPTMYEDTQGYETIQDEHGYKTVAMNPEQKSTQFTPSNMRQDTPDSVIGRADLNNFVKLLVPESDIYGITLTYKYYYSDTGYYYSDYGKYAEYSDLNEAQTQTAITLGEFDWSIADKYIITIDTAHGIYTVDITTADLTHTITLGMDSTYVTPILSVPFNLSTYNNYGFDFLVYDDQGECITNYYMNKYDMSQGYKIPSGRYKIQAFGSGPSNSFSLFKTSYYNLTPSTKTITFASSEMAKVSYNQTAGNSSGKTADVKSICFLQDNFYTTYHVDPSVSGNISYIYVTKGAYTREMFYATPTDSSDWKYEIDEYDVDTSAGPVTINYDLAFKAQFKKSVNDIYGHGSVGRFTIVNNNGQLVPYIYDQNYNSSNKIIKFTKGAEVFSYTTSSEYVNIPNPSQSGTFSVDFSTNGPLSVTPLKDSIYINRSTVPADDANVYYSVASTMNEGQGGVMYITAWNFGTNVWTSAGGYKLAAVGGSDPFTSTLSNSIPAGVSTKENAGHMFVIPITAPTRGIYTSDWQMMKGSTAFGNAIAAEIIVRSVQNPYKAMPISITSVVPDKAGPQPTGTKIRWTCNITGGKAPVYYFKIYKGSTLVKSSTAYSATNYFDWTPTAAGTDYRALVYVKENGAADTTAVTKYSSYYTVSAPVPIAITSILPDKASPQLTGTKIRWTTTISGGKAPVYYYKIYKGSTVVTQSSDYSTNNYFDWTPTAAGTDYRALVYVKENGASYTTRVEKYSGYYTIAAPIAISSILPDKASPQPTGTKIRWTTTISGGKAPVYYYKIYKGSTVVAQSSDYSANNYFDWTPTAAGTDYRAMVYVKENGASYTTRVSKYSSYFTVTAPTPITITSISPDKASPQMTGTKIRWTTTVSGGKAPVYYYKIYKGSTVVAQSSDYSTNSYFDWTPTAAGSDYRAMVYVKENGASYTTRVSKYSSYYTIAAPIAISSLTPDKASPQPTGTKIRWTCTVSGGKTPVYYFRIYKGSTVVAQSSDYSTNNYFDWTPTAAGTDYRALVYVKENGASYTTRVEKYSSYFTVTAPTPKVKEAPGPDTTDPGLGAIHVVDIPSVK